MEAVSAGASIVAFVTVALQSTATLYKLFSGIKDAPRDIQQLAESMQRLHSVLAQLLCCPALADPRPGNDVAINAIKSLIDQYLKEIKTYEARLAKLATSADGHRAVNLWKKIKTVLNDKDLKQIQAAILDYKALLSLQLQALQVSAMADTTSQLGKLEINISQQTTTVEKTSNLLEQQESHLIEVKGDVRSMKDGWSEMQTRLKETIETFEKKTDSSIQLMELLKQGSGKIETISQQQQNSPLGGNGNIPADSPPSSASETTPGAFDSELLESIERLSQLVSEEEQVVPADHITEILDDLSVLIRAPLQIQSDDKKANVRTYASGLRGRSKTLSQSRTLKHIDGLFSSSFHVAINKGVKGSRPGNGEIYIGKETALKKYSLGSGTLTVWTNKRRCLRRGYGAASNPTDVSDEDLTATVTFLPRTSSRSTMIIAKVHQKSYLNGFTTLLPSLSVNPILPKDSYVFDVVLNGYVDEFLELLRNGKASVRDHSENGWSLLHYARDPQMVQLLLEYGADVDEMAPYPVGPGKTSLQRMMSLDFVTQAKDLEEQIACRKLLLSAGADPTLGGNFESGLYSCAFDQALDTSEVDGIRLFLDATGYIDLKTYVSRHSQLPALLYLINMSLAPCTPDKLELLLNRGANIRSRGIEGLTCLHILLSRVNDIHPRDTLTELRDCFVVLLQRGVDVYATDDDDISVTEYAYSLKDFVGDVWDAALARCNFSVSDFRMICPWRQSYPFYSEASFEKAEFVYRREDFERLWEGMEHLCPYYPYDDEEYDASQSSDDGEDYEDGSESDDSESDDREE